MKLASLYVTIAIGLLVGGCSGTLQEEVDASFPLSEKCSVPWSQEIAIGNLAPLLIDQNSSGIELGKKTFNEYSLVSDDPPVYRYAWYYYRVPVDTDRIQLDVGVPPEYCESWTKEGLRMDIVAMTDEKLRWPNGDWPEGLDREGCFGGPPYPVELARFEGIDCERRSATLEVRAGAFLFLRLRKYVGSTDAETRPPSMPNFPNTYLYRTYLDVILTDVTSAKAP